MCPTVLIFQVCHKNIFINMRTININLCPTEKSGLHALPLESVGPIGSNIFVCSALVQVG